MPLKKKSDKKISKPDGARNTSKQKRVVSPKTKAHKALVEKQNQLELALRAAHVGTWELNLKTNQVKWSSNVHEILGIAKKDLESMNDGYANLIHPDDRENVARTIQDTITTSKNFFIQHRVIHLDKSIHWVEAVGDVVLNRNRKPVKLTGTVQDITSKKQVELEKEDWKIRYETVAISSGQVIYDYDISTGKILWSGHVNEVLGYNANEMGDVNNWADLIHPDDKEAALRELEAAEVNLKPYDITYRFKAKSGEYATMHDRGIFLPNAEGKAYRMLGAMQDISDNIKAQEDLLQSNRFKETVENAMPGVLYVYDLQKETNVYSNLNMITALGYTPEEAKNMGSDFLPRLLHPDDRKLMPSWSNEEFGTVRETEYRMKTKSGEWRWFLGRDTVFQRDEKGNVVQIVGIAQDVTKRKQDEAQIYESEQSYRTLFNSVGEAIYIQDPGGTFVDVNDGACRMYGYKREEFIGQSPLFLSADGKNDFELVTTKIRKAFEGVSQTFEFWGKKKNGVEFLKEVKVAKGTYFGKDVLIATARDITERKQIEIELKESEQRFRTLQQASFGGIGMHDKGIIIDCNQGLCDLTGYSREELIGANGLELVAPEWRDLVMEKILSGFEKHYDVEGIQKNGTRYFLEVQAKNIPYQGRMIRVTEFRNITERKLAEEKIIEQNARLLSITEDLKRKNDQMEEFTQIVSHNLRSPVGNILTLINFFETSDNESEKAEYIALLKESGITTQKTLHELNEVLKIKQNKRIERQEIHFEDALQRVKSMLSAKITEVGARIRSDFSKTPSILYPNIYMESIFLNLLSNSLKYSHPDRRPEIYFKTYYSQQSIILEATDNGLGINLERYGHQVFKLHKTFHRHPESRGIGLFMIKNQIEAMGGEITISSQVNEGTTIFVNFNKYNLDGIEASNNSPG